MKPDFQKELHRVAERMFKAGTTARKRVGDIAHEAIREWGEVWHQVLGEHGKSNGHDSKPSHDEIAARAYTIWVSKGCPQGTSEDDWAQAERELHVR